MRKLYVFLSLLLAATLLAGCAGTPVVYYTNCTCPVEAHENAAPAESTPAISGENEAPAVQAPAAEGALKTGLALITTVGESVSASDEDAGEAKYDVTVVAVTLDENDVIQDCVIDGISHSVKFDAAGALVTELGAVATKNELGENYGMVAWGGAIAEWDEQAAALADFAVGKTPSELRSGAIDASGKAPDGSDLAASATIYLGGYVSAIEEAAASAQFLGAQAGDTLKYAVIAGNTSSAAASADAAGNAQLDADVAVITMNGDIITSCLIDSVQAKVAFDASGAISSELNDLVATKNQLGENYGMKAWGGAIAEWNEQAASFAAYVAGKTPAEVAGIAVNEKTAPADVDLASSVTIAIGGFQALIAKAAQG